jgi:hypothetical protein
MLGHRSMTHAKYQLVVVFQEMDGLSDTQKMGFLDFRFL